ncbi:hypothetical protein ACH4GK_40055 [Streptomyces rimosus]|uniref:hypothetical protein n=1 Tax=Streptomyces TaxID=1883 RepID=UPI0004C7CCAE|nr:MULTISPECIES: hypothetical protein [Streptomyces]KOT94390.1 hypothetical protein ADK86_18020 [Streptomyces sp. NRRL F-5755]KWT60847.1 hypothetical protein ADL21_16965 [Streptomyces albus subsp. albus]
MAVSWAKRIAVTEPAPKPVRYARYLAPHWQGLLRVDSENGIGIVPAVAFFGVLATVLFGAGGAAVALLVGAAVERDHMARTWLTFDLVAAVALSLSYWLVGRYGLRFYDTDPATNDLWRSITVANTAWRSLPRAHRAAQKPRLRAVNTAARILLADPADTRTHQMLHAHADVLRHLATTVLADPRQGQPAEPATAYATRAADAGLRAEHGVPLSTSLERAPTIPNQQ